MPVASTRTRSSPPFGAGVGFSKDWSGVPNSVRTSPCKAVSVVRGRLVAPSGGQPLVEQDGRAVHRLDPPIGQEENGFSHLRWRGIDARAWRGEAFGRHQLFRRAVGFVEGRRGIAG